MGVVTIAVNSFGDISGIALWVKVSPYFPSDVSVGINSALYAMPPFTSG